ncbi:hypothetical protein [Halocynthiibacter namhaensis]|uniref:AraC-like ligand-binding domain-containing protein n=1 Tax=Halocynthiibacter namhaensis TaxID=1290553 RepID=UPI0005790383|nr:hypothetical protein [Halocynthiibacter namhaensis]
MYHWTSHGLSASHAYEAWRDQLSNSSVPWHLNSQGEDPFSINYAAQKIGKLAITHCKFSACSGYRNKTDIYQSADALYCIQFMVGGRENVAYDDNRDILLPSDAYIWDSEKEFTFCTKGKVKSFSLSIPRASFFSRGKPGVPMVRKIDFEKGMGALLFQTVLSTFNNGHAFSQGDSDVVERAIIKLATIAFHA